jgi:hypothetical protein
MAYLLDANIFIEAKNHHYGFDLCPGFWDWLKLSNTNGLVYSIEKVRDELAAGNDELTTWAHRLGSSFFLPVAQGDLDSLRKTAAWAQGARYTAAAVSTFLVGADFYLVAQAHAGSHVVVTREVAANTVNRIKIPNACRAMGVQFIGLFEVLRREGVRFVLAQ